VEVLELGERAGGVEFVGSAGFLQVGGNGRKIGGAECGGEEERDQQEVTHGGPFKSERRS
jgi:hypothetical protein